MLGCGTMFQKPFVVLDLETTGFYCEKDQIIEVALIRYEKGQEVDRFDSLVKIDVVIPSIVSAITSITNDDLKQAPQWSELRNKVQKYLDGAAIVCHNVGFDTGFLKTNGIDLKNTIFFDTVPLAQI